MDAVAHARPSVPPLTDYSVDITDAPHTDDYRALLLALEDETAPVVGRLGLRPLGIVLRAPDGRLAGGLMGRTAYRWLFIELLLVPANLRGAGVGSALVRAAEVTALHRGCYAAQVETADFQARPFYEKLGYHVVGMHKDLPPGRISFILDRRLSAADWQEEASTPLRRLGIGE